MFSQPPPPPSPQLWLLMTIVHTAGEPLTPAAIIPAVTREEAPHLPAMVLHRQWPPPYDEPVARYICSQSHNAKKVATLIPEG